jgi:pimeloyl-ACP methyl ester carboxylesterase
MFLHDIAGLLDDPSFLDLLAARYHVVAPELPGYGASTGEELLDDMLDFTLHAWDVANALALEKPAVVGHGMGGMIAAEMAAIAPAALDRLTLVAPFGLWHDAAPVPDLFSLLPYEFPKVLFANPELGARLLLTGGGDFGDLETLKEFYIGNTRRLGTAGKILFPIPDRHLAKRLYRITTPTLLVWGEGDALLAPPYAPLWRSLMPASETVVLRGAGHMIPYEQPHELFKVIDRFLAAAEPASPAGRVTPLSDE